MIGCHVNHPVFSETCRDTQSGPDVKRGKGENTKAAMSSANRSNYAAEDLEAAARAYSAGAKISRVCNEYSGVPDRTIRYRETCLSTAWCYEILVRHQSRWINWRVIFVTGWSECRRTAC